jgi:MFS transporter, UMF1 family
MKTNTEGDLSEAMSLLERLGLNRPALRAWAMYEWAITGMWAVVVATVFPIYFQTVLSGELPDHIATRNFAWATTIGIAIVAVVAPIMGAITDRIPIKKLMLGIFTAMGVLASASLYFISEGNWFLALAVFILINVGANGSTVFYDALLPHIATNKEIDRVSTGGFAMGYLGAGLLLTFVLLMIQQPGWFGLEGDPTLPVRLSFVCVGIWWALFAIPIFLRVPEPLPKLDPNEILIGSALQQALSRLVRTMRELRSYRNAFLLLLAYFVYGDGLGTIIRMAAIYGSELGIKQGALIGAVVMVQFVGVPFTFLFGDLAGRIGTKRAIYVGLFIYTIVSVLGYFMTTAVHFFILAFLVGMVQGGVQALSRSFFASMIPKYKSGEFFGFYGVIDKFAGVMGPTVMASVITMTGSSRFGILSIILFFVVGGILLYFVDETEGRRMAAAVQARAEPDPDAEPVPSLMNQKGFQENSTG